jgi:hypothetical protein
MLHIMILIFIFAGKYTDYKAECSSYHAENTFLCMRLHPRGLTPSTTGMDDRYEDEKSHRCRSRALIIAGKTFNAYDLKRTKLFPVFLKE